MRLSVVLMSAKDASRLDGNKQPEWRSAGDGRGTDE
jgi:hypothetical protein